MKLVCPLCSKKIIVENNKIKCLKCKKEWKIIENVPSFVSVKFSSSFGLLSDLTEVEINKKIERKGFENSLNFIMKKYPSVFQRIMNDLIRNYLSISSLTFGRCLEIGSGYGALTIELSKFYKEVASVDISFQRIKFIKERIRFNKIKNVTLVHSDAFNLPFPDNYFDDVYLVGVLEWIPLSYKGNPKNIQINFLKILKK